MRNENARAALLLGAAFLLLLTGCVGPDSFGGTREEICTWGATRGFVADEVVAGPFQLLRLSRGSLKNREGVTIYIESDGAPWPSPWYLPRDPTPLKPIAMALAAADPAAAVLYLGRPCQYLKAAALATCSPAYWGERRFAPEVIAAYNDALDAEKKVSGAQRLRLVGYSGGGVIATLLAAQRNDVELLVTVAAPLAVSEWVHGHDLSPLKGSLDPANLGTNVRLPPSVHWVGGHDRIVPPTIVEHFVEQHGGQIMTIPDFGHECCWSRYWTDFIERTYTEHISLQEHIQ
ncbi:conserved hypothetical protein [Gammaproteobacteria bacterium]